MTSSSQTKTKKNNKQLVDRIEDNFVEYTRSTLKTLSSYPSVVSLTGFAESGRLPCQHSRRVQDCTIYAFRGLVRGLLVGFGMRSTFKLAIALVSRRLFKHPLTSLSNIFGLDSIRFATFIGTLGFSYRSIQCLLCKLNGRPSGFHAAIAGFIAGFSCLIDKRERRDTVSLFLFVRAVYELVRTLERAKRFPSIPHGSMIVFALCQIPILHSFYFQPKAMNRGYYNWIMKMGAVTDNILTVKLRNAETFIEPCQPVYHEHSCWHFLATDFPDSVLRRCPQVYLPVHILPSLLFKTKWVFKYPLTFVKDVIYGTLRSCLFLGTYIAIAKSGVCFWGHHYRHQQSFHIPLFFNSTLTGLGLLFEHPARHPELMQYVIPRALEICMFFLPKGPIWFEYLQKSGLGNVLLFSFAVSLFVYAANTEPPLKNLNAAVFRVIFGPSAYLLRKPKNDENTRNK